MQGGDVLAVSEHCILVAIAFEIQNSMERLEVPIMDRTGCSLDNTVNVEAGRATIKCV